MTRVYELSCQGRYREAAEQAVARIHVDDLCRGSMYAGNNILLAGESRVGKTLLSDLLSQTLTAPVLRMDDMRLYYFSKKHGYDQIPDISRCRESFYEQIFSRFPRGLIIEGSDIYTSLIRDRFTISGPFHGFLLGINKDSIAEKARWIQEASEDGHCWKPRTTSEALDIAHRIFRSTRKMKVSTRKDPRYIYVDMAQGDDLLTSVAIAHDLCVRRIEGSSPCERKRPLMRRIGSVFRSYTGFGR